MTKLPHFPDYVPTNVDSYINAKQNMGLIISDSIEARLFIRRNGIHYFEEYATYRLSFCKKGQIETYRPGTTFEQIVETIAFDNLLKEHLMAGVRQIELWIRSELCYTVAEHFDNSTWYLDDGCLRQFATQSKSWQYWRRDAEMASDKLQLTLADRPPLWQIAHELSFSFWSRGYDFLHENEKLELAKQLNLNPSTLENWLMQIVGVRNRCSHHKMVWAHIYSGMSQPDDKATFTSLLNHSMKASNSNRLDRLAMRLYAIHFILKGIDSSASIWWTSRLKEILAKAPVLSLIGFHSGWSEQSEWS